MLQGPGGLSQTALQCNKPVSMKQSILDLNCLIILVCVLLCVCVCVQVVALQGWNYSLVVLIVLL